MCRCRATQIPCLRLIIVNRSIDLCQGFSRQSQSALHFACSQQFHRLRHFFNLTFHLITAYFGFLPQNYENYC